MMKKTILLTALVLTGVFFLSLWGQTKIEPTLQKPTEKTKMADVSPELREKAFGLLSEVIRESENLKLPQNRIELKIRAADLLWEKDEKQARKVFLEVQNELEKLSSQANGDASDDEEVLYDCRTVDGLQENLFVALIERDVVAAEMLMKDSDSNAYFYKRKLFEKYLTVNPQKAFESAQNDIKENDLSAFNSNMMMLPGAFSSRMADDIYGKLILLYRTNPVLGAKLAREILEIIKTKKINVQSPMSNASFPMSNSNSLPTIFYNSNANMKLSRMSSSANNLMSNSGGLQNNYSNFNSTVSQPAKTDNLSFSQAAILLRLAGELNSEAKNKPAQVPVLPEYELKMLASMLADALIAKRQFDYYEVDDIYPALVKYAPNQIQKLRRQMTAAEWTGFESRMQQRRMPFEKSRNLEDILRDLDNVSPEKRDEIYAEAAKHLTNYAQCSEVEDGLEYYLKIEKKEKFPELNQMFANSLQSYKARNGDVRELRKILALEKDSMRKVELISETADAMAQKGDVENAKKLLAEAQKLLPEKYKNSSQLRAYTRYAGALATLDTNVFSLLETLTAQADENINTVANFFEFQDGNVNVDQGEIEHLKRGEFLISSVEFQSARHAYPSVPMFKKLARTDFERTVKLADKFSRPEIRLFARWHIAESLLNKDAESKESSLADYREGCG
ncbi:MAG: hypothetical protein LH614_14890 [Pyrinomonadaceae bacterium]|nr:hypothetical protein [Pyrinomonadaceae bacterium]